MSTTPSTRDLEAARPRTGLDTFVVLDRAVVDLADRRFMRTLDAPAQLHLLASLCAQAEEWLREQVAIARHAGASWGQIGGWLGVTATLARQRYAAPPSRRRSPSMAVADRRSPLAD